MFKHSTGIRSDIWVGRMIGSPWVAYTVLLFSGLVGSWYAFYASALVRYPIWAEALVLVLPAIWLTLAGMLYLMGLMFWWVSGLSDNPFGSTPKNLVLRREGLAVLLGIFLIYAIATKDGRTVVATPAIEACVKGLPADAKALLAQLVTPDVSSNDFKAACRKAWASVPPSPKVEPITSIEGLKATYGAHK